MMPLPTRPGQSIATDSYLHIHLLIHDFNRPRPREGSCTRRVATAATAPPSKQFLQPSAGPRWIGADRLLDWIARVRARRGPTTATNGHGPRVIPSSGAEVYRSPRHRNSTPKVQRRAKSTCLV
jgi:hypothetical protein